MLVKYEFEPGVNREGTQLTAGSGWYDADKIRFRKGRPEQIGGWAKYSVNAFLGVCRSLLDWVAQSAIDYLGLGTNLKFYVSVGDGFNDVTPIRTTTLAGWLLLLHPQVRQLSRLLAQLMGRWLMTL